jgi:hypothetical protein
MAGEKGGCGCLCGWMWIVVDCGLWKVEGWEGVGVGLDGCGEWWGVECFIEGKKGGRERL